MERAEGKSRSTSTSPWSALRQAVKPYEGGNVRAAERGYDTPFQQLVACVISIRTRDEESLPISDRLFEAAPRRQTSSR